MTKRATIKNLLDQLLDKHVLFFKRLYATSLEQDINDVIKNIPSKKLDNAIKQCQSTLDDRNKWLGEYRDKQIDDILGDEEN